jgi:hypothetical protein
VRLLGPLLGFSLALTASGCAVGPPGGPAPSGSDRVAPGAVLHALDLDPVLEDRILALDPDRITERDLRGTLAAAPAPQVIGVHGGIYPVHLAMESFVQFLIEMGYPENRLRHPGDGRLSHSPYEASERLTGLVAWYYEHEGLRPMLVGHSQGGVQTVKVLYDLAGQFRPQIPVWNPRTDRAEDRFTITDPLTGAERPVVGLSVAYAAVVGAGGYAVLSPNQWSMLGKVRSIPDTVEEFTAFAIDLDLIAWDFPGLSGVSAFQANGAAKVRNVRLPAGYSHVVVPVTAHLPRDIRMKDWINRYTPGQFDGAPASADGAADNALWAADVWYSIKRHWCLEAQRLIRAKRATLQGGTIRTTGPTQGREDARAVE